jgi:3-hydroxybutyryl-CoA dehydrogenase
MRAESWCKEANVQVQTIGIAGLGLLGRGIASCLLARGFRVVGYARSPQTRDDANRHIADAIKQLINRAGFPADLEQQWPARFVQAGTLSQFADCDFVIESVIEDLDAKRTVFDEIEAVVGPVVPVASNTSALPISLLQKDRKHPRRFIGMHWAEPCHITQFLEVVRGDQTDDQTLAAALELAQRAGKDPSVVQKDVEGFIANRLGYAMYREAFWLLENGVADIETIDRSFRHALSVWANIAGPFRWMDLSGLTPYAAVMERLWPQLSCATEVPRQLRELVASGARGIANGRGFYNYTPSEARQWESRLIENAWRARELSLGLSGEQPG